MLIRMININANNMVSIIIPVYNRPDLLVKALKSIEQQMYQDFELVIIDDGSNDDIETAVHDTIRANSPMQNKLNFFRVEHGGANKARNYGFSTQKTINGGKALICRQAAPDMSWPRWPASFM